MQLAKLGGNPISLVTEHPQYLQAQAQVDEAQRQLDHTVVTAPFAGTVTNVPAIAPGKYLAASTTAFFSSIPITSGSTPTRKRPS
jgi:membrane fusion protein (multidrug efflux system)